MPHSRYLRIGLIANVFMLILVIFSYASVNNIGNQNNENRGLTMTKTAAAAAAAAATTSIIDSNTKYNKIRNLSENRVNQTAIISSSTTKKTTAASIDGNTRDNLPFCTKGEHINGDWILHNNTDKKRFTCCSWDVHNINEVSCLREEGENGRCEMIKQGANKTLSLHSGGHACECDKKYGRDTVSVREKYIWEPKGCKLLSWNASAFCSLLGDRVVLLIGDSTMLQSAVTLVNMINFDNGICATQIHIVQSNFLDWMVQSQGVKCPYDITLINAMQLTKPDVVIFTTGAHLGDIGDLDWILFSLFIKKADSLKEAMGKNHNVSFVWKTQNPGHFNCDNITAPNADIGYPIPEKYDAFRWNMFPDMDKYIYKNADRFGYKILDMSPLYHRGDAHPGAGDCLHFCLPGPVDLFSILLMQMLYNKEL